MCVWPGDGVSDATGEGWIWRGLRDGQVGGDVRPKIILGDDWPNSGKLVLVGVSRSRVEATNGGRWLEQSGVVVTSYPEKLRPRSSKTAAGRLKNSCSELDPGEELHEFGHFGRFRTDPPKTDVSGQSCQNGRNGRIGHFALAELGRSIKQSYHTSARLSRDFPEKFQDLFYQDQLCPLRGLRSCPWEGSEGGSQRPARALNASIPLTTYPLKHAPMPPRGRSG